VREPDHGRSLLRYRPSVDELRVILDAIPAPVFDKDAAGVYRGCNKAFEAYLAAIVLAILCIARPAAADDDHVLHMFNVQMWDHHDEPAEAPKLVFGAGGYPNSPSPAPIIAHAADGKSVWVASDLAIPQMPCGEMDMPSCDPSWQPDNESHASVLFDGGNAEHPLVLHVGDNVTAAEQAKAKPKQLPALEPKVEPGAEDAVKLFAATLADPKAFAKTVSDRKDVVLYGSDRKERFVGGKQVRATLEKWHLAIAVRDGIVAGVTRSKTVAWVAANVEVRDAGSTVTPAKAKTTPYRLTVIYERTGTAWKLVLVHFSFVKA
jgi:hypothetical protein